MIQINFNTSQSGESLFEGQQNGADGKELFYRIKNKEQEREKIFLSDRLKPRSQPH